MENLEYILNYKNWSFPLFNWQSGNLICKQKSIFQKYAEVSDQRTSKSSDKIIIIIYLVPENELGTL